MPKMAELIRKGTVPPNILRSAAEGRLALPAGEMVEVLVELAENPTLGIAARATLARWESDQLQPVLADPQTPHRVLNYFLAPGHRRPDLVMTLVGNASVPNSTVAVLAETASRTLLEQILHHERAQRSTDVMVGLAANPELEPAELEQLKTRLRSMGEDVLQIGDTFEYDCALWMLEHAAEIAAEAGKAFELTDTTEEEKKALEGDAAALEQLPPEERERVSTVQKIARMRVGERVQLAMKGNKDERFVLIRDGSKIVALAVLESPKVSDGEVEMFASMKNVQEDVLRGIARKRKFMKNYSVVRQLVNNPRTPLDLALGLVSHLLVNDLKSLSMNKNVSDTVKKLASKMFKEKSSGKKGD